MEKRTVWSQSEEKETNVVTNDGDIVVVYNGGCVNLVCQDSDWLIDSGVSYYVNSHSEFFTAYTCGDFGNARTGNSGVSKIVAIGDIFLETNIGSKILLKDVRHIPNIRINLISTGKLDDEGYCN